MWVLGAFFLVCPPVRDRRRWGMALPRQVTWSGAGMIGPCGIEPGYVGWEEPVAWKAPTDGVRRGGSGRRGGANLLGPVFPGAVGKNRVFHTGSPGSYNMYYVKLPRVPVLPVLRTTPWLPSGSWAAVESAPSPAGLTDPLLETLRYRRLRE